MKRSSMLAAFSSRCICGGIRSVLPLPRRFFVSMSANEAHALSKETRKASTQKQLSGTTLHDHSPNQKSKTRYLTKDEQDRLAYLYSDGKDPYPRQILHLFPGVSLRSLTYRVRLLKGDSVKRRKRWSPDEIEKLLSLVASGLKTHELLGVFPDRTESAIGNMLARWRPNNLLSSENLDTSEEGEEMIERDRNDDKSHSTGEQVYVSENNTPSVATTAFYGPLPWIPMQEPRLLWTETEDDVLKKLVQRAMKTQPDRWRRELSQLLSDPEARAGLDPSRNLSKAIIRLEQIQSSHFVSKRQWTPEENELLLKAVSSQTGLTFDPQPTRVNTGHGEKEHSSLKDMEKHGQVVEPSKSYLKNLRVVNWKCVALGVGTKDHEQCRRRFALYNVSHAKGMWTSREKELFQRGVVQYGQDWKKIASLVGTRTPAQIRSKYLWHTHEKEKE